MKIKHIISDIEFSHEDLVNILSMAFSYSSYILLNTKTNKKRWMKLSDEQKTHNPCAEDILADLLLAGKKIQMGDAYVEDPDENNSDVLKGKYSEKYGARIYEVGLKDFARAGKTEEGYRLLRTFEEENDDLYTSENFLQLVMFGDYVYG